MRERSARSTVSDRKGLGAGFFLRLYSVSTEQDQPSSTIRPPLAIVDANVDMEQPRH
jgi:hypothetical protein